MTPPPDLRTPRLDAHRYRSVLGHYPTGVAVITAMAADGLPAAMVVGSFTSVSLDPPLVAFLPAKTSSSFPRIRTARTFCVNVLSADQADVCRTVAASTPDKLRDIVWAPTQFGAPRLDGVSCWVDCAHHSVHDAGDHYVAFGRVLDLGSDPGRNPLVFLGGRYGAYCST